MAADRNPREKGLAFVSEAAQTSAHASAACADWRRTLARAEAENNFNIIVGNNIKKETTLHKKYKSISV